jgi:putative ABC transport system permease protein
VTLALRELIRRPRNFAVPSGILLLLALLLLYPMAVLDGVYDNFTGGMRAVPGELMVFKSGAHRSIVRSRLDAPITEAVQSAPGVAVASPFMTSPLGGTVEGIADPVSLGIIATDRLAGRDAPDTGTALADESLRDKGVRQGSTVLVGPFKTRVQVVGFTRDTNIVLAGGFFVSPDTFRTILAQEAPDAVLGPGKALAMVVTVAAGASIDDVARAIDTATNGQTETVRLEEAISALPGLKEQQTTFAFIRGVTLFVALVVVALFLSFVTLERMPLYAVLKAVGASSRQLFTGVVAQVLAMSFAAVSMAVIVTFIFTSAVQLAIPNVMRPSRIVETMIGLSFMAALGSCLSLRRVVGVDPASAIG